MPSPTGDDTTESCNEDEELCWRRRCWGDLATTLPGWLGRNAMWIPSHADNNAAESYWRWCCQDDLAAARCRCWVMLATALLRWLTTVRCRCWVMLATMPPSRAGNGAAGVTWPWRDVDAKSYRRQCCWIMLVTMLLGWLGCDAARVT
jgi:hypothetical protein